MASSVFTLDCCEVLESKALWSKCIPILTFGSRCSHVGKADCHVPVCPQCWENGIILCRKLAEQYEGYYDYRNLSKMRVKYLGDGGSGVVLGDLGSDVVTFSLTPQQGDRKTLRPSSDTLQKLFLQ